MKLEIAKEIISQPNVLAARYVPHDTWVRLDGQFDIPTLFAIARALKTIARHKQRKVGK